MHPFSLTPEQIAHVSGGASLELAVIAQPSPILNDTFTCFMIEGGLDPKIDPPMTTMAIGEEGGAPLPDLT